MNAKPDVAAVIDLSQKAPKLIHWQQTGRPDRRRAQNAGRRIHRVCQVPGGVPARQQPASPEQYAKL